MPTLHTIYRSGVVSHVGIPKKYNITGLLAAENGGKQKVYSLNSSAKKKISSSLAKMWHERRNNLTFLTFTFKNVTETYNIVSDQKKMNEFFSAFLDNFKKTYALHSYIWVSERTKTNAIHYHVVCDFPKLKKERYVQFEDYFKADFKAFLTANSVSIDPTVNYSFIGLPSKRDRDGNYRGACVRSMEAVQAYVAGYLKKSQRIEMGGRIYAISRNVLERPIKTFNFYPSEVGQQPKKVYDYEYCSVRYYSIQNSSFDNYFLRKRKQKQYETQTDHLRKMNTKMITNKYKSIVQFENLAQNSNYQPEIIERWDWSQLFKQCERNETIEAELPGSFPYMPFRHKFSDN